MAGLPTICREDGLEGASGTAAAAQWPVLSKLGAALPAVQEGEEAVAATSERPARNGPKGREGAEGGSERGASDLEIHFWISW